MAVGCLEDAFQRTLRCRVLFHTGLSGGYRQQLTPKSAGEIQRLIENDPVFSHPTLHRLWIAKLHDQLAPLKAHIELFFQLLAIKVHREIFDAVPQLDPEVATKASAPKPVTYSRRSTTGSPKPPRLLR